MSYSHSWSRIETPAGPLPVEPREAFGRLAFDTLTIIQTASERGIALADGAASDGSQPVVDEGGIWLNGARPDQAETFAWPAAPGEPWWSDQPGRRWWDACSTNHRPFDAVVCAILIRAGSHYGASVQIRSDGGWNGTDIDGRWWPEWAAGRGLVVDLFGPQADVCPWSS